MMEVDADLTSQLNSLKRCSSEPSINVSEASPSSSHSVSSDVSSSSGNHSFAPHLSERGRRFSTSYAGLSLTPAKVPSRLDQIKLEECIGQSDREAAHEKEVQSAMLMSQSWDELSLEDGDAVTELRRPRSFTEPLHVLTSLHPYASSPSPTRVGKQCFSPSLQQPVRNYSFIPSPGSSPTRQSCVRRSLSPIVLRPSPLSGVKRKAEADSTENSQNYFSPAKKFCASSSLGSDSTPEHLQSQHHLLSSSSSGASCSATEEFTANSDEQASSSTYEITTGQPFKGFLPAGILTSAFSCHMVNSSFTSSESETSTAAAAVILPETSDLSDTNETSMTDMTSANAS